MHDWFAIGTQFHPEAESASALDIGIFDSEGRVLAADVETDAAGRFQLHATMPSLIGRAGITWLTRAGAARWAES